MSWADDTTQLAADVIGALAETVTLRRQAAGAWSASTLARAVTETTYTLSGRVTRSRTTPVGEPGAPEQSVDVLIKTADLSVEPAAGDLLDRQRVGEQRLAEPAVLLGDHQAEDPHLLHALDDLRGVLVLVLQLGRDRDDLLVDELPDELEEFLLLVGEVVGDQRADEAGRLNAQHIEQRRK